ncbi:oligosaccharide repeat unit polymerase [Mitsuaria sp. GD03876]|uniref:oligosaccharide repeat unit polymerase n=1 Tax=Mitsuaria sp. GD03876 TaxID=2975399 RepID=UPI00244C5EF7|nr:oligosaccharide repeat unit polymerase [Mitsuaria sp. GD03876]MDH0863267.1 oligosaccharide repeat unit polymerase [Mitsuaria sp. GD03876]
MTASTPPIPPAGPATREEWAGTRAVIGLFIVFNVVSLIYSLVTDEYNGDFYGVPVRMSTLALFGMFVLTTLPFLVLARLGRRFDRTRPLLAVSTAMGFLKVFVPLTLALQAFVTWRYGVGIIGGDPYEVGGPMKILVLLLNRFQPFYLGALLIVMLPRGSWKLEWTTILLMVVVGLLRAGIGVFLYLVIIFVLKYFNDVVAFVRRRKLATLAVLLAAPFLIATLYQWRNTLRETEFSEEKTIAAIAAGLFTGRMSSLTNTAVIYENSAHFSVASKELVPSYYYLQTLSTFLGAGFNPPQTPQLMLINMNGEGIENFSYMTGSVGELMIANHVSWLVAAANLAAALLVTASTLWLARQFDSPKVVRLAVGLLAYPIMSGVPSEMSGVLYFFVVMTMLMMTVAVFIPKSARGPR